MNQETMSQLISALRKAIEVAAPARASDQKLFFQMLAIRDRPAEAESQFRDLLHVIKDIPELQIFDHARQHAVLPSGEDADHFFLMRWLISRAQQCGCDQAVANLVQYLDAYSRSDSLVFSECLAIQGVSVKETLRIGDLELTPWTKFPKSDRTYLRNLRSIWGIPEPTAVLVGKHNVVPRHSFPWTIEPVISPHSIEPMIDALRCSCIVCGIGYRLIGWWIDPPDWVPYNTNEGNFLIDATRHPLPTEISREIADQIGALHAKFTMKGDAPKTRLRLISDWLNRSMCARPWSTERAIELGIALESLFAPHKLSEGLGRTIRTRAAKFLGTNAAERRTIFEAIRDVYELRSRAVHTGGLSDDKGRVNLKTDEQRMAALVEGQEIVLQALGRVVREGEPDWDDVDIGNWPVTDK